MRRWLIAIVTAAVVGVVAGGITLASAAPNAPRRMVMLNVMVMVTMANYIDLGMEGESAGDLALFEGDVMDMDGMMIGRLRGQCVVHEALYGDALCNGTFSIDGMDGREGGGLMGQIAVQGPAEVSPEAFFPDPWDAAVIGGTMAFNRVRGEAMYSENMDGEFMVMFDLFLR